MIWKKDLNGVGNIWHINYYKNVKQWLLIFHVISVINNLKCDNLFCNEAKRNGPILQNLFRCKARDMGSLVGTMRLAELEGDWVCAQKEWGHQPTWIPWYVLFYVPLEAEKDSRDFIFRSFILLLSRLWALCHGPICIEIKTITTTFMYMFFSCTKI